MSKELTVQELEDFKQIVCDEVDAISDVLLEASHAIHSNPELNFEEHFAHEALRYRRVSMQTIDCREVAGAYR